MLKHKGRKEVEEAIRAQGKKLHGSATEVTVSKTKGKPDVSVADEPPTPEPTSRLNLTGLKGNPWVQHAEADAQAVVNALEGEAAKAYQALTKHLPLVHHTSSEKATQALSKIETALGKVQEKPPTPCRCGASTRTPRAAER